MSVERAKYYMSLKPNEDHPLFGKIMSTQSGIMASVFSTSARIDETMLRRRQESRMDELIDLIREERERLTLPGRSGLLELDAEELREPLAMPEPN